MLFKITALSCEEQLLFKNLIKILDRKIQPGLAKLTWNSDFIDTYIKDCFAHTKRVRLHYKLRNLRTKIRMIYCKNEILWNNQNY